jgi:predicted O-linked N-acetylglucosamine transferase (SPINDLY family)
VVTRADVGLPEDAFVMGAFGNVYKITPEMFAVWMRLLKEIPDSILWLIDDNPTTTENLKNHAKKANADLTRINFSTRTGHREFCARLKLCDTYLDTYPYNCGSTSNDVVRNGIPLITKYGPTMVSRMGLSICSSNESKYYAVKSDDEYIERVLEVKSSNSIKYNFNAVTLLSFEDI